MVHRSGAVGALLAVALVGLAAAGAFYTAGEPALADGCLAVTTVAGIVPAAYWAATAARRRRLGVDVVALLALAGTLAVGEYFAGAVITLMLASGRTLEARAQRRARRDLTALLARAPRVAHRNRGGSVETVPADQITPGDHLVVKPGEIVPVDGTVESAMAVTDESTLTGEARLIERPAGDPVRSGVVNAGAAFELLATTTTADSTYAGIVRLVEQAEASSAPFVRLADRYAAVFLVASVATAAFAGFVSGDPARAVAVLVVATPCPLILAAPVAIVGGLSSAARRGVVVKGGGALERLADARVLLFDKTGTLTSGRPRLTAVVTAGRHEADDLLRLAASVDQVSPHVVAAAIVSAAVERGMALSLPADVEESPGRGVRGLVEGHLVAVGTDEWAGIDRSARWAARLRRRAHLDGSPVVFVAVDDEPVGALVLDDPIRVDAARSVRDLRRAGITRVVMVTGDHQDLATVVGSVIGVDAVVADRSPSEKVVAIDVERKVGTTIMVGDGLNDAPALAHADVGVAMGVRGATAASEAADVVLTSERLDRLADAISIAHRARRIGRQSAGAGIVLSVIAMGWATAGFLPPAIGALVQEAIDVAVILNALRALRQPPRSRPIAEEFTALGRRFSAEHARLRPRLAEIKALADAIDRDPRPAVLDRARAILRFLTDDLLPHEAAEEGELYPAMARMLGGDDPTGAMSRAHAEISNLVRRFSLLVEDAESGDADAALDAELRQVLYGLHAVLELHFAQEDEGYLSVAYDDSLVAH